MFLLDPVGWSSIVRRGSCVTGWARAICADHAPPISIFDVRFVGAALPAANSPRIFLDDLSPFAGCGWL
jgi:hypothetical protein